jgi:hypothetical protein
METETGTELETTTGTTTTVRRNLSLRSLRGKRALRRGCEGDEMRGERR